MDLRLSENQRVLVDSARRFFARAYPLDKMREIFLLNEKFDPSLWRDICELGWNAAALPEEIGGYEGGVVEAMLLLIEMGRSGCLTPFPHSSVATALALANVEPSLSADIAASSAVIIPVPLSAMPAPLSWTGAELALGARPVAWAELATHFLCETRGDAFLVSTDQPAVELTALASSRGEPMAALRLTGARATRIAPSAPLFAQLRDFGAFACAAMLQGICERSLELSVEYAKERVQFGRPIGSFQAIQHKAADMRIATDVGRVLVMRAAAEREPLAFRAAASRAKAWTSDAARKVTREAMQMFGGVSFAGDHPIQLFYQAVITLANHYGTAHSHRAELAAQLLE